ncbi:tryptophan synthase subunit alpha [Hoeflea sp.]|uniref:tryptophan synthase subunit alpha n=1 Tax=Hoeflea sp. TaxID=1940281 RepID=UPI003B010E7C
MDGSGTALHKPINLSGEKLLAAYFPVLDPRVPLERLGIYDDAGVDLVELGMKAADPHLEGDTISRSMMRSTGEGRLSDAGVALRKIAGFKSGARSVIFAYPDAPLADSAKDWTGADILLCAGPHGDRRDRIVSDARAAGVAIAEFVPHQIDRADIERAGRASAYVMLQYAAGRTGIRDGIDRSASARLQKLRQHGITVPVLLGVGISAPDQCRHALDCGADGIVIGTKTVMMAERGRAALMDYLGEIRQVIDGR